MNLAHLLARAAAVHPDRPALLRGGQVVCSYAELASRAAHLAGHLRLGNLICLYLDNKITIEGSTSLAFTEDVGARFESFGWHVQRVNGGGGVVFATGTPFSASLTAADRSSSCTTG